MDASDDLFQDVLAKAVEKSIAEILVTQCLEPEPTLSAPACVSTDEDLVTIMFAFSLSCANTDTEEDITSRAIFTGTSLVPEVDVMRS